MRGISLTLGAVVVMIMVLITIVAVLFLFRENLTSSQESLEGLSQYDADVNPFHWGCEENWYCVQDGEASSGPHTTYSECADPANCNIAGGQECQCIK